MSNLRAEERRLVTEAAAAASKSAPSPRERERVHEAAKQVIERRREVPEELARH